MGATYAEALCILEAERAAELAALVRWVHQQGWAPATNTNYSFRDPLSDGFVVSRSGIDKAAFSPADFIRVSPEGIARDGQLGSPSGEAAIHAMLFRLESNCQVVLHTHSEASMRTGIRAAKHKELRLQGYQLQTAWGQAFQDLEVRIPVYRNSIGMPDLARNIEMDLRVRRGRNELLAPLFLVSGHGLYTWGETVADARRHLEAAEALLLSYLQEEQDHGFYHKA